MKTEAYDGRCKVTEFVFVRYTVAFRPGMVFAATLRRICETGKTYQERCADDYGACNRCSIPVSDVQVVTIQNGYR